MLGTLGFSVAALAFAAYGYTSWLFGKNQNFRLRSYSTAYYAAALGALCWMIGTLIDGNLEVWVLLGDAFIMLSTVLLVRTLVPVKSVDVATYGSTAVLAAALLWRAMDGGVNPVLRDSVLVFNTPRLFGVFLAIVLLVVWVRANMQFYQLVVLPKARVDFFRTSYFAANVVGIVGVSAFLFARKSATIILGFTMVILTFLTLTALNYQVSRDVRKVVPNAK